MTGNNGDTRLKRQPGRPGANLVVLLFFVFTHLISIHQSNRGFAQSTPSTVSEAFEVERFRELKALAEGTGIPEKFLRLRARAEAAVNVAFGRDENKQRQLFNLIALSQQREVLAAISAREFVGEVRALDGILAHRLRQLQKFEWWVLSQVDAAESANVILLRGHNVPRDPFRVDGGEIVTVEQLHIYGSKTVDKLLTEIRGFSQNIRFVREKISAVLKNPETLSYLVLMQLTSYAKDRAVIGEMRSVRQDFSSLVPDKVLTEFRSYEGGIPLDRVIDRDFPHSIIIPTPYALDHTRISALEVFGMLPIGFVRAPARVDGSDFPPFEFGEHDVGHALRRVEVDRRIPIARVGFHAAANGARLVARATGYRVFLEWARSLRNATIQDLVGLLWFTIGHERALDNSSLPGLLRAMLDDVYSRRSDPKPPESIEADLSVLSEFRGLVVTSWARMLRQRLTLGDYVDSLRDRSKCSALLEGDLPLNERLPHETTEAVNLFLNFLERQVSIGK